MAGLVPAFHVGTCGEVDNFRAAVGRETLSSPYIGAQLCDVGARDKPGNDVERVDNPHWRST